MEGEDLKKVVKKEPKKTNTKKSSVKTAVGDKSNVQKYKLEKKKKKININDVSKNLKKVFNKKNKLLYIIGTVIFIVIVFFLLKTLLYNIRMGKFKKYEEKMDMYALSSIYNNSTAKTEEYITKLEGIKVVIASIFNTDDISGFAKMYNDYDGETWIRYAEYYDVLEDGEINNSNKDEKITYIDLVRYFSNAKKSFLDLNVSSSDDIVLKDAAKVDTIYQVMFADFVASGIIETEKSNIDVNQYVFKGLANEIVINYLEKLGTTSNDKARHRVTEMPKNTNEYPYILFDNPQKVYEYSFVKTNESKFVNPKEYYKKVKKNLGLINQYLPDYLSSLYTVDYTNLKVDNMYKALNVKSENSLNLEKYKEYCNYVIKNKIKTEMEARIIQPCIYFDGEKIRARIEAKLKIISAGTRENLLYGDIGYGKVTYPKNEYTFYFDVAFNASDIFAKVYVTVPNTLINSALNKSDLDITEVGGAK